MTAPVSLKATSLDDLTFPELMRLAVKQLAISKGKEANQTLWLREEPQQLHKTLLDLKQHLQDQLPPLRRLHFITAGPFPYSGDVVEALDLLQQANAIARENPDYQKFSPKIFRDTRGILAQDLQTLFGANRDARTAFDEFVRGLEAVIADP